MNKYNVWLKVRSSKSELWLINLVKSLIELNCIIDSKSVKSIATNGCHPNFVRHQATKLRNCPERRKWYTSTQMIIPLILKFLLQMLSTVRAASERRETGYSLRGKQTDCQTSYLFGSILLISTTPRRD